MSHALGLDLGSVRIGVAATDPGRVIASPYDTVRRGKDHAADHATIGELIADAEATLVVVGLPRALSGRDSDATRLVRAEVTEFRAALSVPVVEWDERFSTVTAQRSLIAGGMRRRQRKDTVDKVAAAVILQSWLDAGAPEG